MRKRYRIGEIVSSTGISSHALKYYEQEGVLQPLTDEQTGYRYYNASGLGRIISIHRLRQFGFSVKDIRDLFLGVDIGRTREMYAAQAAANEAEIARLTRANAVLRFRLGLIERIQADPSAWEVRDLPPFRFVRHWKADEEQIFSVAEQMEDSIETFNAVWVPGPGGEPAPRGIWGMLRFDREGEPAPPRWENYHVFFPGGPCLVHYPVGGGSTVERLEKHMEKAAAQGHPLTGEAFSVSIGWLTEGEETVPARVFLFPIKPKNTP